MLKMLKKMISQSIYLNKTWEWALIDEIFKQLMDGHILKLN